METNNKSLSREQKRERFERLNQRKQIKVTVDKNAYIEAFKGYNEFFNSISTEFVAEDGRLVRECV